MQNKHLAFIFPGQGSQHLGMLSELADIFPCIQETFKEASSTLDYDTWQLAQIGPEAQLNATEYTQPLLLAASVALWRAWCAFSDNRPAYFSGHSLGEYTAFVCADALTFKDALELVALRGRLMQAAVPKEQGSMAAIIGLTDEQVQAVCQQAAQGETLSPANFNSPGQVVIAGEQSAIARAVEVATSMGAKRVLPLPVSVPSHCALMADAAKELASALEAISILTPHIPVVQNVDVTVHKDVGAIKQALVAQLYSPVRWVETIEYLAKKGITDLFECGPGKVLTGLNRRIDKTLNAKSLSQPESFELIGTV